MHWSKLNQPLQLKKKSKHAIVFLVMYISLHWSLYDTVKLPLPFKVCFCITKQHCNLTNLTYFCMFSDSSGHEFLKLEIIGGVRLLSNSEHSLYCVICPVKEKTVSTSSFGACGSCMYTLLCQVCCHGIKHNKNCSGLGTSMQRSTPSSPPHHLPSSLHLSRFSLQCAPCLLKDVWHNCR